MDDIFRSYILPALIGSGSAILIGFLELVIFWRSNKGEKDRMEVQLKNEIEMNKSNNSIQYITDKRIDWIYKVREVSSELVTAVYSVSNKAMTNVLQQSDLDTMNEKLILLELLLNFGGDIDSVIIKLLTGISNDIRDNKFDDAKFKASTLVLHLKVYLKLEWNRAKKEVNACEYEQNELKDESIRLYQLLIKNETSINNIDESNIQSVIEMIKSKP